MGKGERITRLCGHVGDAALETLAEEAGAGRLLAQILADARAGAGIREGDLDTLDEKFTTVGIDGLTTQGSVRSYHPPRGTSEHPVLYAWVCPQQLCSRVEADEGVDGRPPSCELLQLPMVQMRLAI